MTKKLIALSTLSLLVAGCDSVKHTFGLDHYQADEYSVPTTPPLSMPPDHNLRAPEIHAQPQGYTQTQDKAKQALGVPSTESSSETESALDKTIKKQGQADPEIRKTLDQEASTDKTASERLSDIGKEVSDNLSGKGGNTAENPASRKNPASTR
ncbi:MAG: DUF3035 domain-containing protein [Candidatus Paracaedibacteraceae bacterium]|nr:DUF3035 domain-containing protein [Candidatus Paracaedibacteraceae bacterium]